MTLAIGKRGIAIGLGAAMTFASAARTAVVPHTEELQNGRWVQVDQAASQPATDPELNNIEDLINAGHYSEASKRAVEWLNRNKTSPLRDRGLFLNAEALYRYGDRIKSFFYLDELLDEYPESRLYYPALEKQYQIADQFLDGYKSRFLGIPMLERQDEAIEMLYRVQQRSPGSPLAERALLRTADYYYANADYDLAADAYAAYARSYARSPLIPRVKLRQAFANLAQFRGLRFDATPIIDARAQLTELKTLFPDFAAEQNVDDVIARIDEALARKLFITGDFYRRTRQPAAAAFTWHYLIDKYPNSPTADEARAQLARLPPGAALVAPPATAPSASTE
jgi:outer membrane assembly lipoprotein YfiO